MKRKIIGIAAVIIATAFGAAAAGCEGKDKPTETLETTVESSETESSVTLTPTETTDKATPAPTEAPGETTISTETSQDDLVSKTIDINGLTKTVEDGIVVYKNENGEIQASFNPNIIMDGENIGGYALPVDMIDDLLSSSLNADNADFKIILPLDITSGSFGIQNSLYITNESNLDTLLVKTNQYTSITYTYQSEGTLGPFGHDPVSFKLKDNSIIRFSSNTGGLLGQSTISDEDTIDNNDIYIIYDRDMLKDKDEYLYFDEYKIFSKGEKVGLNLSGYLAIWCNFDMEGVKTSSDDLLYLNGSVATYFPVEETT